MPAERRSQLCFPAEAKKNVKMPVEESCLSDDHINLLYTAWYEFNRTKQGRNIEQLFRRHVTASARYSFLRFSPDSSDGESRAAPITALNMHDADWIMGNSSTTTPSSFIKYVKESKELLQKLQMNFRPRVGKFGSLDTDAMVAVMERFVFWMRDADGQPLNLLGVTDMVRLDMLTLDGGMAKMETNLRDNWSKSNYHCALISIESGRWIIFLVDRASHTMEYFDPTWQTSYPLVVDPLVNAINTMADDIFLKTVARVGIVPAKRDCSAMCLYFLQLRVAKIKPWDDAIADCRSKSCDDVLSMFFDTQSTTSGDSTSANPYAPYDLRLAAFSYILYLEYINSITSIDSGKNMLTAFAQQIRAAITDSPTDPQNAYFERYQRESIMSTCNRVQNELMREMPAEFQGQSGENRWQLIHKQVFRDPLTEYLRGVKEYSRRQKEAIELYQELMNWKMQTDTLPDSADYTAYVRDLINQWYVPMLKSLDPAEMTRPDYPIEWGDQFLVSITARKMQWTGFAVHLLRRINDWLTAHGRPAIHARINQRSFQPTVQVVKPFTTQTLGDYRTNINTCEQTLALARQFLQGQGMQPLQPFAIGGGAPYGGIQYGNLPVIGGGAPYGGIQYGNQYGGGGVLPVIGGGAPYGGIQYGGGVLPVIGGGAPYGGIQYGNQYGGGGVLPGRGGVLPAIGAGVPVPNQFRTGGTAPLPLPSAGTALPQLLPTATTAFLGVAMTPTVAPPADVLTVQKLVQEALERAKDGDQEATYSIILQRMRDVYEKCLGFPPPNFTTGAYANMDRLVRDALTRYVGDVAKDTFEGVEQTRARLLLSFLNGETTQFPSMANDPVQHKVKVFLYTFVQFVQKRYPVKKNAMENTIATVTEQAIQKLLAQPDVFAKFLRTRLEEVYSHLGFTPPAAAENLRALTDQAIQTAGGLDVLKYNTFQDIVSKWGTLAAPIMVFLKGDAPTLPAQLKSIPSDRDKATLYLYIFTSFMQDMPTTAGTGAIGGAIVMPVTDRLTSIKQRLRALYDAKLQPLRQSTKFEAWYFPLDVKNLIVEYAQQFAWDTNLAPYNVESGTMPKLTNDRDFMLFYGMNLLEVIQMIQRGQFTAKRERDTLMMATSLQQQLAASESDDVRSYYCELTNELYRAMNTAKWPDTSPSFELLSALVILKCPLTGISKKYTESLVRLYNNLGLGRSN